MPDVYKQMEKAVSEPPSEDLLNSSVLEKTNQPIYGSIYECPGIRFLLEKIEEEKISYVTRKIVAKNRS